MLENVPLPWAVCETAPNPQWYPSVTVYSVPHGRRVADAATLGFLEEQTAEISAFIVMAVNSHDALVKALEEIVRLGGQDLCRGIAAEALRRC